MTTLFYSPGTCALSVLCVLEWLGEPYDLVRVERERRQTPEFLAINPHGKVPAIATADGTLTEVSAILGHLVAAHPARDLAPTRGRAKDLLEEWYSYLGSGFHAAFYPYFGPQRYIEDPALHEAVRRAARVQIRAHYAFVDGRLAQHGPWLLGDSKTVLDPYLAAMSRWGEKLFDLEAEVPRVAEHLGRMRADAGMRVALAIERGETDASTVLGAHTSL